MICLRLLVAVALTAGAAPLPVNAATMVPPLVLDHIGIQTADLDRSTAFYVGILGLAEAPAPFPRAAVRWIALGGGHMLHIVGNGPKAVKRNHWDHIALACADLDALIAHLDERGIAWTNMEARHKVQRRLDGVRQIFFQDPDGYTLEVNDTSSLR